MGDQFSEDELRELHRLVQQAALVAYPNPERIGCPGTPVLEEMAGLPAPFQHPAYEHVKKCSPCLQEMLELRTSKIKAQQTAQRERRLRMGIWASVALLVIAAGLSFQLYRTRILTQRSGPASAVINFSTTSASRGSEIASVPGLPEVQSIGRKQLQITIYLVPGSEAGQYQFEILPRDSDHVLLHVQGPATISNGLTSLVVSADLSHLEAGVYRARVKRLPLGEWRFLELEVK
jgi:hypothetical protein